MKHTPSVTSRKPAVARRAPAPSPAVAGFRPAGAAIAVATVFAASSGALWAQPSGAQVVHGQASFAQQGGNLVVTTRNGAGTNHSAINWQSFSVPAGSFTRFVQPNANSTSINRVLGGDPSAIFGTLSSNGKLVLVNPAGITVGAGAVVDTAAFTASTLRMSDADALSGRLQFSSDGLDAAALQADGRIVARSGDVVLISHNVQAGSQALLQAPDGATMLVAGQKVAVTGRGLEGIQLQLQAPTDRAVNLGTLQGDAVGIFAGQLRHSGLIQATAATSNGGKVSLRGQESADIGGTITAIHGSQGGQVHATAGKVRLRSGAVIDVSAPAGGGEVLLGGGWQGKDARIANAAETSVEAGATVRADATEAGNGGTIVAWSDGATRMHGDLSARGGVEAGNGGQVETSGHWLDMQGTVDTRAPNGQMGGLLLDPTNVFIALNLASATAAAMTGSDATVNASTPPTLAPSGTAQDSLLLTSTLQLALATSSVTVTTSNLGGTGLGNITVVDPVNWSTGSQLTLNADNAIFINAPINGAGPLSLRANGAITQGASITAPTLLAISNTANVSLANTGNSVGVLSGYAGAGGNFSFTNNANLSVGTASGSFGVGVNSNTVNLRTTSGNLSIDDTVYGVNPGSGNATLQADSGSVLQAAGAKLNANTVTVVAGNQIQLSAGANSVSTFFANQTGTGGGSIAFVNNSTTPWTLGGVSQAATTASSISVTSSTQSINVAGLVQSGPSSSLTVSAGAGALLPAGGSLQSNTITLQAGGAPSGAIGSSGVPLPTASNGGATLFTIGATGGPSLVNINHTGSATLTSVSVNPNAPVMVSASQDLNVASSINTGTSNLKLGAGNQLYVGPVNLTGTNILLEANRMQLAGAPGSINGGASLIQVAAKGPSNGVDLGSVSDASATAMELSAAELATFAGTGVLHLGSTTTTGPLNVSAPVAPGYGGAVVLQSGGAITQASGASITASQLGIRSLGDVTLNAAPNAIGNLAAQIGDAANQNRNVRVSTGAALNVGSGIDGMNGIGVAVSGGYSSAAPDGVISLVSAGPLTQSAGALLGGKAVYAEGSRVVLTNANPTGVIAGKATGAATGDVFQYVSGNGINVNTVDGRSGIVNASGPDAIAIELQGAGINQQAGSSISTPRGVKLVSSGPVNLTDAGNSVGSITGSSSGAFAFADAAPLTVGIAGAGVSASGAVDIQSASGVTVASNVVGAGVKLAAGAGSDLVISSLVDGGGGANTLMAGRDVILQGATLMGTGTTTATAGSAITVAPGISVLGTSIANTTPVDVKGTLSVNSPVTVAALSLGSAGDITGPGDLTVGSSLAWNGGTMTGTGKTIIGAPATMSVTGSGALARPLVNNGTITLSASGQIVSPAAASFDNATTGTVDIQNDGGFSGAGLAVTNSGMFKKSGGTGISDIAVSSFINNGTGTVEVDSGTLRIGGNAFASNSGTIMLASGATLATANSALANAAGAMVWGSGTLDVGTANFSNDGILKPGGAGTIGTLNIVAANVTHGATAQLKIDLTSAAVHDVIASNGNVVFVAGSSVLTTDVAPTYGPGAVFDVVTSSAGTVSGTLPTVAGFITSAIAAPAALRVATPPAPAPSPSPTPAPAPTPAPSAAPTPTPATTPAPAPSAAPTPAPAPTSAPAPAPTAAPTAAAAPVAAPAPAPASMEGDSDALKAQLDAKRRITLATNELDSTFVTFVRFQSGDSDKDKAERKNSTIGITINENVCKPS